jgi:hypothetical protein
MAAAPIKLPTSTNTIKVSARSVTSIHTDTNKTYYRNKIEAAELEITKKTQNLRRLEAQRNALNGRGESS